MRKTLVSILTVWVLVSTSFVGLFVFGPEEGVMTSGADIYVPGVHPTIQAGIDAAGTGDTVHVAAGVYYENVIIDKDITLEGDNRDTTIINGRMTGEVIRVESDGVTIKNFTITNGSAFEGDAGIKINGTNSCEISNNNIYLNFGDGIALINSSLNNIFDNNIIRNGRSNIYLNNCSNNTIHDNTITGGLSGIDETGLVSYWKMNKASWSGGPDEVRDHSVYGNHGRAYSGANTVSGIFGRSGDFDGSGSYINVDHSTSLNIGEVITIEAWIKPTGGGYKTILMKGNYGYGFAIDTATNKLGFWDQSAWGLVPLSDGAVTNDIWQHVAVTVVDRGGSLVIKYYINGESAGTVISQEDQINNNGQSLIIGEQYNYANNFNGLMDEVKIYNRVFSDMEIALKYQINIIPQIQQGIQIENSKDNTISNNHVSANLENGIALSNSNNNSITHNTLTANGQHNIYLNNCSNNIIQENTILGRNSANETGLVGYWKMDEASWSNVSGEVQDQSGFGNHGQAWEGASTTTGKFGRAGDFNGVNGLIDCGNGPSVNFGTNSFSITGWFLVRSSGVLQIVAKGGYSWTEGYYIRINDKGTLNWHIMGDGLNTGSQPNGASYGVGKTIVTQNKWHHFAMVVDLSHGITTTLYLDGKRDGYASDSGSIGSSNNNHPLLIGVNEHNDGRLLHPFDGLIDEVKLYNRALTPSEISLFNNGIFLYNSTNNTISNNDVNNCEWYTQNDVVSDGRIDNSGRIGYWKMDEELWDGTADEVEDYSGLGNHGTVYGDATTTTSIFGRAGYFDGEGDWIDCGNDPSVNFGTNSFSITGWFRVRSSGWQQIVAKGGYGWSEGYFIRINDMGTLNWHTIGVNNAGGPPSSASYGVGNTTISLNEWHHFAMVVDLSQGITTTLYLDGIIDGKNTDNNPIGSTDNTFDLTIGAYSDGTLTYFDGFIDEIEIYNRVLSPQEVAERYQIHKYNGIYLFNSDSNILSENNVNQNIKGITLYESDYNNISNNNIDSNDMQGIHLSNSNDNMISENTVTGNGETITETGLVGYWKMDEASWDGISGEVKDSSGQGNHGNAYGPTTTAGKFGRAGIFDGDGDSVVVQSSQSLEISNDITIEAWLYVNGNQDDKDGIVHKFNSDSGNYYGYRVRINNPSQLQLEYGDGTSTLSTLLAPFQVELNQWHHFAVTKEETQLKIFLDGIEIASGIGSANIAASTTVFQIGHNPYNTQSFNGKIDDVKIYNRALSEQEISNGYLRSSTSGIRISNSTMNTITENTVSSNKGNGIGIQYSTDNDITNNVVDLNHVSGIALLNSTDNVIAYNTLTKNELSNIHLDSSNVNNIKENAITGRTLLNSAGMAGYWKMDEESWTGEPGEVEDHSGQGNHGTAEKGANTISTGKFGKAGDLEKEDSQIIAVDHSASLDITDEITVGAWIYLESYTDDFQTILCKGFAYNLMIQKDTNIAQFEVEVGGLWVGQVSLSIIPIKQWTHILGTYDSQTGLVRIFINGVEENEGNKNPSPGDIDSNNNPLWIGRNWASRYFDGLIDEVVLYDRALSPSEVAEAVLGSEDGIKLYNSNGNILEWNSIALNYYGVHLSHSESNIIMKNTLTENEHSNLLLEYSDFNAIENNTIFGSGSLHKTGLVGYWKMNEPSWDGTQGEVQDLSGQANHGTAIGEATTTTGKFLRAGEFDGDGDSVVVPTSQSLEIYNDITIEAWLYVNGPQDSHDGIVSKFSSDFGNYYGYRVRINNPSQLQLEYGDGTSTISTLIAPVQVELNQWHHFAATKEGTQLKMFLDGIEIASGIGSANLAVGYAGLNIGHNPYNNQSFNGKIDEVKIYNRALSGSEISEKIKFSSYGIRLYGSINNTILNNNISWNFNGIDLDNSDYNNLSHNTVSSNMYGIWIEEASNNSVEQNSIFSNKDGIVIENYAMFNNFTGNDISFNHVSGVFIGSNSENNYFFDNTISNNINGFYLDSISYNNITYNLVSNNRDLGIWARGSTHDLEIHHNDIINNTIQARDDGTDNKWDNGVGEGNYWSDWTSPDLSPTNGIVDNPRLIEGSNGSFDNYPLTNTNVWIGWGPVYNMNKKTYHKTIMNGVALADNLNRLWVSTGIYYENVVISSISITLLGQDRENTIIDAGGIGDVIKINWNDVNVRGFTLMNGSSGLFVDTASAYDCTFEDIKSINNTNGINLIKSHNNTFKDLVINNNEEGIFLDESNDNHIINSTISSDKSIANGIRLINSNLNTISNNLISSNPANGILLESSSYNNIEDNTLKSNFRGIRGIGFSSGNEISRNDFTDNTDHAIYLDSSSSDNLIYHNNFFNNWAYDAGTGNLWNAAYPTGGNFWWNYTGPDNKSGPNQNINGSDWFGDIPYNISGSAMSLDNYPLTVPKPYYPDKPQNLIAVVGDYHITLSWNPPGFDGGLPIMNYKIYRGTISGEEELLATIGDILWFKDTTVLGGEVHYYVRAVNDMGEGKPSDKISATPIYVSPMFLGNARHTGLSLYNTSDIDGALKWSYDAGSSIYSSPAVGNDGTIYFGTYNGDLIAVNPDGTEKWRYTTGGPIYSSPAFSSDGTILIGANDDKLHAVNPDGSPKWNFTATENVYSSPVIGYDGSIYFGSEDGKLYALNPDGTQKWALILGSSLLSSPALGVDDTIYVGSLASMFAVNPDGTIKWSYATGDIILNSPAIDSEGNIYFGSNDNNLYGLNSLGGSILSYSTQDDVHSSPAIASDGSVYFRSTDGYLYAFDSGGALKWQHIYTPGSWMDSSLAIGSDGTIYLGSHENNIYALNPDGTIKWNYPVGSRTFTPAIGTDTIYVGSEGGILYALGSSVIPEAPQNFQTIAGNGTVALTWEAPLYDGGTHITNYTIYRGNVTGGETFLADVGDILTYTDTNVSNGIMYYYTIRAVNKRGEGPDSLEISAKPATIPDIPTLMIESDGDSFINLSWSVPASDGGDAITNYRIYKGTSSGSLTFLTEIGNVLYYYDSDLINGETYYYTITAINTEGEGISSNEVNATPSAIPDVSRDIVADAGDSYVHLFWNAPNYDGGSTITGYVIYRNDVPGIYATVPSDQLFYNDTGLENGITYTYHINAINGRGEGPSLFVSATPLTIPSAPDGLETASGDGYVHLSWNVTLDDGGSEINGYHVYRNDMTGIYAIIPANQLWYNDTNVVNGETYEYSVSAVNDKGIGPTSGSSSATPEATIIPSTEPSSPRNIQVIVGVGKVTLIWSPPETDGGSDITSYRIYRGSSSGGETLLTILGSDVLTYTDEAVTAGQTYYYTVSAENTVGEAQQSSEVSAIPTKEKKAEEKEQDMTLTWILLIIGIIVGLIIGMLLSRGRGGAEAAIPPEEDEVLSDEEASLGIEDISETPDEDTGLGEGVDKEVLESWNNKFEKNGILEVICPSCLNKGQFGVEETADGKNFTCPSCNSEYSFKGQ